MKRRISKLVRRNNIALKKRLSRVPRNFMAPMRGERPPVSLRYAFWSLLTATLGVLAIVEMTSLFGHPLLIGSFGASAVLLFGATESPLAQPRNLVGGHILSAVVAVLVVALFGATESPLAQPRNLVGGHILSAVVAVLVVALFGSTPLTMALGVGLAIFVMNITDTTHPPGGATALIGVQGAVDPAFILLPVLAGTLILLAVACFTNNVVYHRSYPRHWL